MNDNRSMTNKRRFMIRCLNVDKAENREFVSRGNMKEYGECLWVREQYSHTA